MNTLNYSRPHLSVALSSTEKQHLQSRGDTGSDEYNFKPTK